MIYTLEQIERGERRGNGFLYEVCFPCPSCQAKYYNDKAALRYVVERNCKAIGSMPETPISDSDVAKSAGIDGAVYG